MEALKIHPSVPTNFQFGFPQPVLRMQKKAALFRSITPVSPVFWPSANWIWNITFSWWAASLRTWSIKVWIRNQGNTFVNRRMCILWFQPWCSPFWSITPRMLWNPFSWIDPSRRRRQVVKIAIAQKLKKKTITMDTIGSPRYNTFSGTGELWINTEKKSVIQIIGTRWSQKRFSTPRTNNTRITISIKEQTGDTYKQRKITDSNQR